MANKKFDKEDRTSTNRKQGKGKKKSNKKGRFNPKDRNSDSNTTRSNLPDHDTSHDNDISYWNGAGQLYVDATTISSYVPAGSKTASAFYEQDYYTPTGIARFDYIPYFGDIDGPTHPINTTAKVMYNAINAKNSRNPSYDPSDLMLYIIAVAQAWSVYSWVERIVGMFPTFSVLNRYWWEPLCRTMGIARIATDNDIVTWRNLANHMAIWLNRLAVPTGIPYFQRAMWMNKNIYMDTPVGKATYYYYNPASVLKYEYDKDKIGKLSYVQTPWYLNQNTSDGEPVTPAMVESFFLNLIENLFNDSDIPVMSADIMRAFDGKVFNIPQIDSNFSIAPVYTPEVNLEMHNARIHYGAKHLVDGEGSYGTFDIHQDMNANCLISTNPNWKQNGIISTSYIATDLKNGRQVMFDFPIDNPSNDDWMTASRLTWVATGKYDGAEADSVKLRACTELLIKDEFYEFKTLENDLWDLVGTKECINVPFGTTAATETSISKLSLSTKMHDAPIQMIVRPNGSSSAYSDPQWMKCMCDLSNYCPIDVENIVRMHDVAQISVFLPDWLRGIIG